MLSQLAKLLLILTSLAPILVVLGATMLVVDKRLSLACWLFAGLLIVLCHFLLGYTRRHIPKETLFVKKIDTKDADILAFLVAYALPLVGSSKPSASSALGIGAFILLAAIVVAQGNLFHVNPLLGLLGYHFYGIETTAGQSYLLVTKQGTLTSGKIEAARLSHGLYLDK